MDSEWWHRFFNEPMRENGWSLLGLILLLALTVAAVWFRPFRRRKGK